jgi:predicted acetyltransferase
VNLEMQTAHIADKPVLRNLLQLCLHDYSEFNGEEVNEHGIFNYGYLDYYWTERGRYAFLARVDGKLAGFVLVCQLDPDQANYHIAEFFILRKYRGHGLGRQVAFWVFDHFPGEWMVSQETCNLQAQAFWRKIIADYTAGAFTDGFRDDADWRGPTQFFHSPPSLTGD